MADEEQTTTTTTQTGTQPGGASAERTFTQAEVDEIVKNRMRKEFKRQERRVEEKAEKSANPKPDKPGRRELDERKADKSEVEKVRDELVEVRRAAERDNFETALLRDGRFREDAVDRLWRLHSTEKPKDRKAWLDEMHAQGFAVKQPKQETATQAATSAAGEVAPKPVVAASSAPSVQGAHPTIDGGLVDIWNLTDVQIAQMGPQGLRKAYEDILARGRSMHGAPPRPQAPPK